MPDDKVLPENSSNKNESGFDINRELYDWADALVTALVFVILLFALVVRIIGVDGSSMVPTLEDGDKVILTNLFYDPQPGDVVVFTKKGLHLGHNNEDVPLVKRVIATEGQTVSIDASSNTVSVDGVPLQEPYINELTMSNEDKTYGPIPAGCVFVMGDNRNNSSDSRIETIGMIDKRYILGHVLARVFPLNNISLIGK